MSLSLLLAPELKRGFALELTLERFVVVPLLLLLLLLPPPLLLLLLSLLLPMGARAAPLIKPSGLLGGTGAPTVLLALCERSGSLVAIPEAKRGGAGAGRRFPAKRKSQKKVLAVYVCSGEKKDKKT